jgi:hypothetical protein
MRFRNHFVTFLCLLGLPFSMVPGQSKAADQGSTLQQVLGSQDPLYKFTPAALGAAIKQCASRDPAHAGGYVVLVLRSGRNDADEIAPSLVTAAIRGLGADPKAGYVAEIVHAAINAAPSEVLDIVTAAVKASPRSIAPAIVTAAVRSVPHPDKLVTMNVQRRAQRAYGNDKQTDYKQLADGKSLGAPAGKQLTLAEAIVQAALDADPSLSVDSLTAAADNGLNSAFATSRPPVLTGVLAPVIPVLPIGPTTGGITSTPVFTAPGPVSP